jgi:chromosome segregation ATPase
MLIVQRDAQRLQQRQEQAWQNERTELRDAKMKAQQKFDLLQAELTNLTMEHANEIDELTARLEDAANATQRAIDDQQATARSNIAALEAENTRLHTQLDNKDDEIDEISDELRRSRMMHKEVVDEKGSLEAKLEKQKTLNEQAAREIQSLRSGNKILQAKLAEAESTDTEAIEKLEHQLEEANVARLEADEEVDDLKSELEAAKAFSTAAEARVLAAEEALKEHKEVSEQVNRAMDKRMKELMRAREAEWTKRMEYLTKEVGVRGQALLREWGRSEMGVGEPQAYRYQFV